MQRGEIVKSKAPRRWMAVFLVVLAVCAVALALLWTERSNAVTPEAADLAEVLGAGDLKCEMVRLWPLPSECLFVFNEGTPRPALPAND
jgi:hypothetical protein